MALNEVWIPSPHYSSSRGAYNKAVLHTTEGAMKIRDLGSWFQNPSAGCSSHHGADNYERGVFGAYVNENHKAWTQGNANDYCLSLEQCAYASWSRDTWLNSKGTLLHNTADWLAYVCGKYSIPLVVLSNSQAQDPNARGICQHVQLGSWGSGHSDCGGGYPMDQVLAWAKGGAPGTPAGEAGDMAASVTFWKDQVYFACVGTDNRVYYQGPDTKDGWHMVDEKSSAKSGLDIAADPSGKLVIVYTNQAGNICTYERGSGGGAWTWANRGGNAR